MRHVGLATFLALAMSADGALATTYSEETIRCPVGGESFEVTSVSSYTTLGQRPDGKPYGTLPLPEPLHECPGNKLVIYRVFTPDEVKQLEPLIASESYRDMVASETSYYRAAWLDRQLKPHDNSWAWILLRATWQADHRPALKTRYQTEFVAAAAATPAKPDDIIWLVLQLRAVNALRELGRFDEAVALLRGLPRDALQAKPGETERDARNRASWTDFMAKLERAAARRDASIEPLDLIDTSTATGKCVDMTPAERIASINGFCTQPEMAKRIDETISNRARVCLERALRNPKVWSDDFCGNPDVKDRSRTLPSPSAD